MLKTCMNCTHYHGCLAEEEPSQYHIHNYCDAWDRTSSCSMHSLINNYLEYNDCDISIEELPEGLDLSMGDDNETGEACCYRFEPVDKPLFPDEWFKENFEHNKKLAICMIEKILRTNHYIMDSYNKAKDNIVYEEVELDDEDRKYYQDLLAKIKAANLEI